MLSIPIDDVNILKFGYHKKSTSNSGSGHQNNGQRNHMDQLLLEFERLSKFVHVSIHVRNYVDNIKLALKAHPLIRRGPSYKRLSMSRYQRQRDTSVSMDGDTDCLRVMAVLCSNNYLLPRHVKEMLPDLLSHRLELHGVGEEEGWEADQDSGGVNAREMARTIVQEVIAILPPVHGEHPRR